ncbi:hypothetical protein BT63DRAFT_433676 [Microthyrium microscopicum]|uniref:Regulatory P domain-containing protein n=1 Tax=Microthyrium microscopicum TaxID=703497 RepID=A0A6A6UAX5_9PEZI|nr:hypothetical protein BT63DRAFT_433676 [Microthyrium microscopicum]
MAQGAFGKELAKDEKSGAELYDSGIMMDRIMMRKQEHWAEQKEMGRYEAAKYPDIDNLVQCKDGRAVALPNEPLYSFLCGNIDLYNFKSHASLGSTAGQGSSSWGWTSPEGREFAAIAQIDGCAFAEITKEGKLVYLGRLPAYSVPSIWREVRGYKDYMLIGSEATGHGIQIFDMKKLLTVDPTKPVKFDNKKDLTGHFTGLPEGSTHNVVINEESQMAYSVGAVPRTHKCRGGIIFINMTNPALPTGPGCAGQDGYVHDAQCLVYRGPDKQYVGREICYGYNEDTLTIYDVTDKVKPTIISKTSYEGAAYTHQGWVLDPNNQEYLLLDDEYDEVEKKGLAKDGRPVTYIWNIASLAKPKQTGYYKGKRATIDHNQYVHDGKSFQSNYGAGFSILNISSIPTDPTGNSVKELGFFDIYPEDDYENLGGVPRFVGSWSSYAKYPSGFVLYSPRADSVAPPDFKLGPKPAGWKPIMAEPALGQPAVQQVPKGYGGAKGSSWGPEAFQSALGELLGNADDDE